MRKSESLDKLAPAIRKVQGELKGAIKDSSNPFFKSKYADLESCWSAVREPLQNNGFSIVQTMGFIEGAGPTVITTLLHESGQFIEGEQPICAKSLSPQEVGSAQTFARRYGLSAIVGLIQVNDDAEAAMGRKPSANIDKDIAIAAQALNHSKTKDEARKIWTTMVQPIFHMMDSPTQKLFNDCKDRIVRELQ